MSSKKHIRNVSHKKTKKKINPNKNEYYLIHCNGGRPMIVTINKNVLKYIKIHI